MLFGGCTTTPPVDSKARALCVQTFGTDAYFKMLWFPTDPFTGTSTVFLGNTGPALRIAKALEVPKDKREDLVFWAEGSAQGEVTVTIKQAFKFVSVRQGELGQLNFLFVGNAQVAEQIKPLIEARGAKFYFHQN